LRGRIEGSRRDCLGVDSGQGCQQLESKKKQLPKELLIAKPGLLCPAGKALKSMQPPGSSDLAMHSIGIHLPWLRSSSFCIVDPVGLKKYPFQPLPCLRRQVVQAW
jgi:hypothetical protein